MTMERVTQRLGGDVTDAVETLMSASLNGFATTDGSGGAVPQGWHSESGYSQADLTDLLTKLEDVIIPALRAGVAGANALFDTRVGSDGNKVTRNIQQDA